MQALKYDGLNSAAFGRLRRFLRRSFALRLLFHYYPLPQRGLKFFLHSPSPVSSPRRKFLKAHLLVPTASSSLTAPAEGRN